MDISYIKTKSKNIITIEEVKERLAGLNCDSGKKPILLSKGRRTTAFYTEDSKRYITPREYKLIEDGVELDRLSGKWDSLSSRVVRRYRNYRPSQTDLLYRQMRRRSEILIDDVNNVSRDFLGQFSVVKLWNMSIVGAIILGMFSMTLIYKYLGQGVSANEASRSQSNNAQQELKKSGDAEDNESRNENDYTQQALYDLNAVDDEDKLEEEIRAMVKGYPIEDMVPYIAKKDRIVAAFLVGIAKKESNWGKRVPVLQGQDCYNYWGYRGQRKLMGTGGHTCFNSRKDAVDTVAKRIQNLIEDKKLNTPEKMVIWKCGSNCAVTGGQAAANKWISDVDKYFRKLNN